jgi:hypothetical protein
VSPLSLTFELYLGASDAAPKFEVLTCRSRGDLIQRVRRLIEERNLQWVEVRELGVPLFTIGR